MVICSHSREGKIIAEIIRHDLNLRGTPVIVIRYFLAGPHSPVGRAPDS